ncbi:MAG: HEAT repeat domain-containing protein [Verrucomicrobiales bacterium]|nr:HEAT repeat domain-containing protein [Verrucomicrobiales bacterium]
MKGTISFINLFLWPIVSLFGQQAEGISRKNLANSDISLMNNHSPASQLENFSLLPGYEVNLFAAEPMLANPIHMTWDARGRLWVACSWAYPQLKPGEKANDKVIILEDTDHDGKADKSTVFADGLYMPTGIALANGGCYVAQTPDVFFFKDTDGDDVADTRELPLTGFGIEDSHHSISAWRRGPGGWLYFQEGIFLHSQVETIHGGVRNYNGGVYQFNPRTQMLRMFARIGVGNPWGHVFDRWGQSFLVDNPRISYLSPATGNGRQRIRIPNLLSTEKQCGGDIASGSHLPQELQGQLLTCRFKSRAIVRYEFIEKGAGFSANVLPPLISSRHPNFRPVDCKVGPDGALYIADWYNSIINHAKHDFRDPRRDHDHGRVWRITAKGRPLVKKPDLVNADIPDLLNHLKSPDNWTRHHARSVLSGRDHDQVAKELSDWVNSLDPEDDNHDHHLVEAMWTCQNIERPSEDILTRVLGAEDGRARAAGARVIRYWHESIANPAALLSKVAGDPFPRARMEAILSAGYVPKAEAFTAVLAALDHPRDPFIEAALPQTVTALEPYWRPAIEQGRLEFSSEAHRDFAEQQAGIGFEARLKEHLKKKSPAIAETKSLMNRLVANPSTRHTRMVVDAVAGKPPGSDPEGILVMLEGLNQVARTGNISLGQRINPLKKLLNHSNDSVAAAAVANLGAWQLKGSGPPLMAILNDPSRSIEVRRAAATSLGQLDRPEITSELKQLCYEGQTAQRHLAVLGLIETDMQDAAEAAAGILRLDPGTSNPVTLVQAFTSRSGGANILANALQGQQLHAKVLDQLSSYHRASGQLPRNLAQRFAAAPPRSLTTQLMRENRKLLTTAVKESGNPQAGEKIFRRRELACFSCHAIGPVGSKIGPNLVAVGGAAQTDYIIEAILQPNKSIAQHYENQLITLVNGTLHMGAIAYKGEKEIIIRDSARGGQEVKIPRDSIKRIKPMPSLMPAGLVDQLNNRQEFLDLARFVALLGRPGPYANDESPVMRRWQVTPGNTDQMPDENATWQTVYSMTDGHLPDFELGEKQQVFARGFVQVHSAGKVSFNINDTTGVKLWIGKQAVNEPSKPMQLAVGRHRLTFSLNRSQRRGKGLRVEITAPPGSPAKFQPEGGF